jgi:hypothetical protein
MCCTHADGDKWRREQYGRRRPDGGRALVLSRLFVPIVVRVPSPAFHALRRRPALAARRALAFRFERIPDVTAAGIARPAVGLAWSPFAGRTAHAGAAVAGVIGHIGREPVFSSEQQSEDWKNEECFNEHSERPQADPVVTDSASGFQRPVDRTRGDGSNRRCGRRRANVATASRRGERQCCCGIVVIFLQRAASSVVEHLTFNQGVPGSIPGRPTIRLA